MAPPRTGQEIACHRCGRTSYRRRSELARRAGPAFCSRTCYEADRKEHARYETCYPKTGERHIHRVVAERKIGRPLVKGEIVHHRDEDKRNPAPGNLDVLANQGEHQRLHFLGKPGALRGRHWQAGADGRRVYT